MLEAGVIRRRAQGALIHAGFFVDSRDFYRDLRAMSEEARARIQMMPVSFTNQLYGGETARRRARRDARFVNAAMKATLMGGVISDVTEGGQIVSGVGGQFNFVEQAFALEGARAIITLPATRTRRGRVTSNIVWEHPHETIPRHLRDIIVTEYGIADLRGKSDAQAIRAMIAIADSRFQPDLLERAKKAGKLPRNEDIPIRHRANSPRRLHHWLDAALGDGTLPAYPFGTDFTAEEQRLLPALAALKEAQGAPLQMMHLVWQGLRAGTLPAPEAACMARMQLARPGLADLPTAWALRGALRATR
jgi:acyl-CoA hydrolase